MIMWTSLKPTSVGRQRAISEMMMITMISHTWPKNQYSPELCVLGARLSRVPGVCHRIYNILTDPCP